MSGLDKEALTPARASRDLAPELYRRHAASLYRQALLILDDEGSAEEIVGDVIIDELTRSPVSRESSGAASCRLAVSVLRRCQELMDNLSPADRVPRQRPPGDEGGSAGSQDCRSRKEREALSLVLFGGLGYRQVGRELAIPPTEAAALLRSALISLAGLPR
jgi:hypothetical protein